MKIIQTVLLALLAFAVVIPGQNTLADNDVKGDRIIQVYKSPG